MIAAEHPRQTRTSLPGGTDDSRALGNPAARAQTHHMVKEHARDIEQREKDLDHREAALDGRRAAEVSILAAAERRDAEAEARDVVADDRERTADLEAFLGTDPGYVEGLPARRHAAQGRLSAKADRAHSADDRDKLTED